LSLLPVISELFHRHRALDIMLKDDGHPTKMTHAALANALRPWIVDHLALINEGRAGVPSRGRPASRANE
jgi:hypothetical protein